MRVSHVLMVMLNAVYACSAAEWIPWTDSAGVTHEYTLLPDGQFLEDAAASAAALTSDPAGLFPGEQAYLVAINTPEEQAFVGSVAAGLVCWIGAYQDRSAPDYWEPGGGWRWVSGEPWSYTNWLPGEPNNLHWAGEDWVDILPYSSYPTGYGWNDRNTEEGYLGGNRGVVERVPEPSALALLLLAVGLLRPCRTGG